ncbi:MAG: N-acetylmuramoyl-L-alanine amidase [Clostridiales Family XIII bacterium]|nr:N-acetylmuramoyl-L-alanine amidase [Clostridiales Family XIII bacterium]
MRLILCAFLFLSAGIQTAVFAADADIALSEELPPVSLRINDNLIQTDVTPVIIEGRTLVPARAVFETLGGTVLWDDSGYPIQLVSVAYQGAAVNLTIGSVTALVNGAEARLDVPAQIVNERTLIPVRFVSESLGLTVRWNEAGRVVDIYSPDYDAPPIVSTIESMDAAISATGTRVSISFAGDAPSSLADPNPPTPKRFIIGFTNTILLAQTSALEWQREISVLHGVTAEQPDLPEPTRPETVTGTAAESVTEPAPPESAIPTTTWFVFDLSEDVTPVQSLSSDGKTLYIDFPKPQSPYDPWADGKLSVILDPGHGAETVGKRSPDGSVMEYAFNRDMAARVKAHLERHGVETLLTVYDDTDMSLEDRCKTANASGADVFVSLHANAFGDGKTWPNQNGWEIFIYKEGSFSEKLAQAIHRETIPASGLTDRGVKPEPYYVIRKVNMPAVLIEHGFYTNRTEIELLKSPEFRERLSVMDAKGILSFLGVAWIE